MRRSRRGSADRQGKVNQILVAVVPPLIFVAGLMIYNAYKWMAPSAFTITQTKTVEALEVMTRVSPTTKTGLLIPQPQSLRNSGSSRLVVSRPHDNGDFILVKGSVSPGFMQEKNPLDNMLHLKFSSSSIRVESGGEPVESVLLLPRTETDPLRVDAPISQDPEFDIMDVLFANQTLLPVPAGVVSIGKFTGDSGLTVELGVGLGQSGTLNFGDVPQLEFTIDPDSSAWIEAPRSIRVQHKAVGTEALGIGILILRDAEGSEPFDVYMFGEQVATVRRR